MSQDDKPIVLITGAAGNLGRSLAGALSDAYRVVGLDQGDDTDFPLFDVNLTDDAAVCGAALVALSVRRGPIRERYGTWDRMIV